MSIRNLAVCAATALLLPAIVRGDDFPAPGDAWERKSPAASGERLPVRSRSNVAGRGHFVEATAWVLPQSVRGRGFDVESASSTWRAVAA